MKKIIGLLVLLNLCSMAFSRVIIQQDLEAVNNEIYYTYDSAPLTPDLQESFSSDYLYLTGFSASALWEFDSEQDKNVHFYTGLDFGFENCGFNLSPVAGFNLKLFKADPFIFEMNTSLTCGPLLGIAFGECWFYSEASLDFIMMKNNRRGFYGGIGIADVFMTHTSFLNDEYFTYLINSIGMHFMVGVRI